MKRTPRTIIGLALAALILLGGAFVFLQQAQAATPFSVENIGSSIGLTSTDLKGVVLNVIRWVLGILTLVAVSFIIYGGFLWLTSNGNERQIEKAKRVILNAVVGLIIVLIAWAIVFFVAKTILNTTDGSGPGGSCPTCVLPPGDPDVGFEIRSITTDCGVPPNYRSDVFRCSAVQVNFNHQVDSATVQSAVNNGTLVIKQCDSDSCPDSGLSIPAGGALDAGLTGPDRQAYSANSPTGTTAEWVAKSDNSGKTITFHHTHKLFEASTSYHVSVPTTLKDTAGRSLSNCQISTGIPLPGCTIDPPVGTPTRFTWTMKVGTSIDTNGPDVTTSYPDSQYIRNAQPNSFRPDRNVPMTPTISVRYDQALVDTISQTDLANPLNNTVAIVPFTAVPDENNGSGGTLGTPVDPTDFLVVPMDDNQGLIVQMKPGRSLVKFTWYKVIVRGIKDLCSNVQSPEPFEWVFETNDVAPTIADHFPRNGTPNACNDTPIFIRYSVSMYDAANSTCRVPLGYVTQGTISPVVAGKNFDVDASQSCNGCADPQNRCMVYTFTPPPPSPPTSGLLSPNTTYSVGVDNRYSINDSGGTLRFGSGPWGDSAFGAWKFDVKPAGSCVNPPVITSIDPPQGTDGQCITVAGFNFDPNSNGRSGGDALQYDGNDIVAGSILGWSNSQIASEVPTGSPGTKNFKVKADFPSPFGNISSPDFPWTKIAGPASTGPCLSSITPASGYNLDSVTLDGKRFGANPSTKQVSWNTTVQNNPTGWADTQISTSVPANPPLVPPNASVGVRVTNDQGTSNRVYFDLKQLIIPPGTPEPPVVVDRWPNCGLSCTNADVGARLAYPSNAALTLDGTTLTTGTAVLRRCQTDACTSYVGGDITPGIVYDGPTTNIIHFPPAANLLPNTSYRAIIKGTIKDANGIALGQLNFDTSGSGTNDSYSWIFKTQSGAGGCKLDRVDVAPNPDLLTSAGQQHSFSGAAYTEPNSCSTTGQLIDPSSLNWSWSSSDVSKATVVPTSNAWDSTVTAISQTIPGPPISISTAAVDGASGISRTGASSVTIDFSLCSASTDCTQGGVCGGSTCDETTRRCTPVITSISPAQGAIGTWIDVNGCYFGSYASGTCSGGTNSGAVCDSNNDCNGGSCQGGSAVIFSSDKRNLWPNPGLCGAPSVQWHDSKVTVEVPDRNNAGSSAISGPLVLQRFDNQRSQASSQSFTVDPAVVVPGICRVDPAGGSDGTTVTITGQQFGATQGANDKVTFYQQKDVAAGDYTSWTDSQIVCRAPVGISNNNDPTYEYPAGTSWGLGEIAVQRNSQWSNVANFNVVPAGCQVCTVNSTCGAGNSCGYNGCCTSSPTVTAVTPTNGQTSVCRNSAMTATFSKAMDAGTFNASTIHVYKGGTEVPSSLNYDGVSKKLTITSGLLEKNTTYTVSLSAGNIVQNGSFESGVNAGAWSGPGASSSTDVPAGAQPGSRSAFANGAIAAQAYQVQNAGVATTLRTTYHVTGWVKVRNVSHPNNGQDLGGLITRCWGAGAGNCQSSGNGFDQYAAARVENNSNYGLFTFSSPGQNTWHRVDFTVTNNTGASVAPSILCFANAGVETWCDDIIVTEIGSSGIRASDGGSLVAYQWTFQTANTDGPCGVARVDVSPSQWSFNTSGQSQNFVAHAYADSGLEVSEVPGVYEWIWDWSIVDTSIADFSIAPVDGSAVAVAAKPKKGTTFLRAQVKPTSPAHGLTNTVGGLATLTSTACENLWNAGQFVDSAINCRPGSGTCQDFRFNLSYCMDGGLPNLDQATITGSTSAVLKEYLFKQSSQSSLDAIGIRVYQNNESLSALEWYKKYAPNPGSPSAQTVDGYDAVKDGRSVYVAATVFDGTSFVPRIFLISITPNAPAGMQDVFNQMLASWYFNNNVNGVCHDTPLYPATESNKTCIQRDLKRLAAISDISQSLRSFKANNGSFPKLASGSFLPQLTFSIWPSWSERLGTDLGRTMPVDPKNTIASCPSGQAQDGTCWNETNKKFVCSPDAPYPAGAAVSQVQSHILGYQVTADGSGSTLYADLEYRGPGNWINYNPTSATICSSPSNCRCFNYSFAP